MTNSMNAFSSLRILSECFDDMQRARISCNNRMERGRSGEPLEPDQHAELSATLTDAEKRFNKQMILALQVAAPEPLLGWVDDTAGIGLPTIARLLGIVGHPRLAQPYHWEGTGPERHLVPDEEYERLVSDLWSYCGHGDPLRKRSKGMSADDAMRLGNPMAKKLTWLMADGQVKNKSAAYRPLYESRRAETAERVHAFPCVRCGPSGKPAQPGSPWSKAHQLADAKRIVGKTILRDIWINSPL